MTRISSVIACLLVLAAACGDGDIRRSRATIDVEPSSLSFDARKADGDPQTLELFNDDSSPLEVTAFELRGASLEAFAFDPAPPFQVPAGGSRKLVVRFVRSDWRNATLVLVSNADNAPRREVPLALFHGGELPDAGEELPDAGEELPDAGEELPDAGEELPDAGEELPDAGEELPDGGEDVEEPEEPEEPTGPTTECDWEFGTPAVLGDSTGVSKLALAAHEDGFTAAWMTDACALSTRRVDLAGQPTALASQVFSTSCARLATFDLDGAADADGAVFFPQTGTALSLGLSMVDLRGATVQTSELDSGGSFSKVSATPSAGGVAALWRQQVGTSSDSASTVRLVRSGGTRPLAVTDTGLPTNNTFRHTIAPRGEGFAVLWHGRAPGATSGPSHITGARLYGSGKVVEGSQKQVSLSGTNNLQARLVRAEGGLAAAWRQDGKVVLARLDGALGAIDGEIVVEQKAGQAVIAAARSRLGVVSMLTNQSDAATGLSIGGVDRFSGAPLGSATLSSSTLGRYVDIAAAGSGDTVLVLYTEGGQVKVVPASCQ